MRSRIQIGRILLPAATLFVAAGLAWGQATPEQAAPAPSAGSSASTSTAEASTGRPQAPPLPPRRTLTLEIGHSMVLSTQRRLRRVYISNPQVVDSITANPNELVLTAKAGGSSSVAMWTEDGAVALYDVVANLDLSAASAALSLAFPGEQIAVQSQEGRLLLTGTASSQAVVEGALKLLSAYAKEVVNSAQVLISHGAQVQLKVRIAEVDRAKLNQFGINLLSNGQTAAVTSTQQFGLVGLLQGAATPSDLLNVFIYNKDIDLGIVLKDLQQNQVLQVLAEPNITAISGQTGRFLSGGEFPYPIVQGSSGGLTSITIQFKPFGVKLEFTPVVNPDNTIRLKVSPEVSALDYTNSVTISGYTIPAISTRKAETEIELLDGQSFAISGLLDHRTTERLSKLPGIGDIPILGEFFKSREINKTFTELIVIITPVIVNPLANPEAVPSLPKEAVPNLNEGQFDDSLKSHNKQPKEEAAASSTTH